MRIVDCVWRYLPPPLTTPHHPSQGGTSHLLSLFHFPELKNYPAGCRLVQSLVHVDHSHNHSPAYWDETINFTLEIKNHQFFHQIPNMGRNFGSVSVRLLKYELYKSQSRLGWSGVMAANCSLDYHQESRFNIFTDKCLLNWTVRWR